mgnify:CR=1 FL=1
MKRFKGTANAAQATTKLVPGATQPVAEAAPQIRQSMGPGITPTPPLSTTNANPRASVPSSTPQSMTSAAAGGTTLSAGMPGV